MDYTTKSCIREIKVKNQVISDPSIIAKKFNEYFVNVGPDLAAKIDSVSGEVTDYISGNYKNSILLKETSPGEIYNVAPMLKSTSRCGGPRFYSPAVIKHVWPVISLLLSGIFNKSLSMLRSGLFPNQMKIAKILPTYKADSTLLINNYRPILLSLILQ